MSKEEVLFEIQKNSLRSATSFVQYFIDVSGNPETQRYRLLTLIGEHHNEKFGCGDTPTISISEYVTAYLERDPKTLVLLEMDHDQHTRGEIPLSEPIRDILTSCTPAYLSHMRYYDPRNIFLLPQDRYELYDTKKVLEMSVEEMWAKYGEPFYNKWSDISTQALAHHSYGPKQSIYLRETLPKNIGNDFRKIHSVITGGGKEQVKEQVKERGLELFRRVWMKVTDWFIMSIMMDSGREANTMIAIMGNHHLTNIVDDILKDGGKMIDQRGKHDNNCVNLYQTVYLEDVN